MKNTMEDLSLEVCNLRSQVTEIHGKFADMQVLLSSLTVPNAKAEHDRDSASASTSIKVDEKPLSCNKVQNKWTDTVKRGKQV